MCDAESVPPLPDPRVVFEFYNLNLFTQRLGAAWAATQAAFTPAVSPTSSPGAGPSSVAQAAAAAAAAVAADGVASGARADTAVTAVAGSGLLSDPSPIDLSPAFPRPLGPLAALQRSALILLDGHVIAAANRFVAMYSSAAYVGVAVGLPEAGRRRRRQKAGKGEEEGEGEGEGEGPGRRLRGIGAVGRGASPSSAVRSAATEAAEEESGRLGVEARGRWRRRLRQEADAVVDATATAHERLHPHDQDDEDGGGGGWDGAGAGLVEPRRLAACVGALLRETGLRVVYVSLRGLAPAQQVLYMQALEAVPEARHVLRLHDVSVARGDGAGAGRGASGGMGAGSRAAVTEVRGGMIGGERGRQGEGAWPHESVSLRASWGLGEVLG